jgi:hypothetical protein
MITIRQLIEHIGQSGLRRLMRRRGLPALRRNEDRRQALARSYRANIAAFVHDLQRSELVSIFRQVPLSRAGKEYYLPNLRKYRLRELRERAVREFAGPPAPRLPEPRSVVSPVVVAVEADAENSADRDEEGEADSEDSEDWDDEDVGADFDDEEGDQDDENEGDDDGAEAAVALDLHLKLTEDWSRPRTLAGVMKVLGMPALQRLRTARFQRVLAELHAQGIEACLAHDSACEPLAADTESPGVRAKLRLRSGRSATPASRSATAPMLADDPGPPITLQVGERPISQQVPRPRDYQLAVLRLQFLTAVPSVERGNMSEWPGAHLAAATRGLTLLPEEVTLLVVFANGLRMGHHSPYDAIPQLTQALSPGEWALLIADFIALNPFQRELVAAIVETVAPIAGDQGDWRPAAPLPDDLQESPAAVAPHAPEPLAASGRRTPSAAPPREPATNVRDMGVLASLFDDE